MRLGYSHDRGTVIRFVVQLEYWVGDEVCEDFAADLGGEPEDYRAEEPVSDGGE